MPSRFQTKKNTKGAINERMWPRVKLHRNQVCEKKPTSLNNIR